MKRLPPEDADHVESAIGWLALGNHLEANAELEKVTPRLRGHPDVLQVRWQVYAKAQNREVCLEIATALTKTTPELCSSWIHRAFALHQLKRTEEAYETLLSIVEKFEPDTTIPYHLAQYACKLGKLKEAKAWMDRAFENATNSDTRERLRMKALKEPDLESFWKSIGAL